MATKYTVEYQSIVDQLAGTYGPLKPTQLHGRVRVAKFTLNTTTTPVNDGDIVYLTKIPPFSLILGGQIGFTAMGAGATAKIGAGLDDDLFLAATSVAAAGTLQIGTRAVTPGKLNVDNNTAIPTEVFLTAGGANYAAGQDFAGYLLYVVD